MSTTPYKFVTHDGTDENGVRAEVYVQANKGTISKISEDTDKQVADVYFKVENLKHPIHGWIPTTEPLFEVIKAAKAANEEVSFRIESQRRKNIDRTTPITELRVNMETARDNTIMILAGINGVLSGEAVTNPEEDPTHTGGRYPATAENSKPAAAQSGTSSINTDEMIENFRKACNSELVRAAILENMASQLILNGVSVETVNQILSGPKDNTVNTDTGSVRATISAEAPAWKTHNSDGRLNLGNTAIAGAVGAETLVYEQVQAFLETKGYSTATNFDDVVSFYLNNVLAICDRVQVVAYGQGSRPDRYASSHTRIRGIVYEIIRHSYKLPLDLQDDTFVHNAKLYSAWLAIVGSTAVTRFNRAIRASETVTGFPVALPPSLGGNTEQTVSAPTASTPTVEPEIQEPPTVEEPMPEVMTEPEPPVQEYAEPAQEVIEETPSDLYQKLLTPADVEGKESTEEGLDTLLGFFAEYGYDTNDTAEQARIARLLGWTFGNGYAKVSVIPDEYIFDFVDFYVNYGLESLDKAFRTSVGNK